MAKVPDSGIRLAALIGGFAIFGLGAWMMYRGISAEGAVDLKSSLVSGTLKTGSAGLFLCFFAFCIVALTLLVSPQPTESLSVGTSYRFTLMRLFWGLLLGLLACVAGSILYQGSMFSVGAGLLGMSLVGVVTALIRSGGDA